MTLDDSSSELLYDEQSDHDEYEIVDKNVAPTPPMIEKLTTGKYEFDGESYVFHLYFIISMKSSIIFILFSGLILDHIC